MLLLSVKIKFVKKKCWHMLFIFIIWRPEAVIRTENRMWLSLWETQRLSWQTLVYFNPIFTLYWAFPVAQDGKESACNVGDYGSIPGLGRSPEQENEQPTEQPPLVFSRKIPWTEGPGNLLSTIAVGHDWVMNNFCCYIVLALWSVNHSKHLLPR